MIEKEFYKMKMPIDDDDELPSLDFSNQYQEAQLYNIKIDTFTPLHEAPVASLAEVACDVVLVEGPVHREEIARRIAEFRCVQRMASRIFAAVDAALEYAVAQQRLQADGDFFRIAGETTVRVRSRSGVMTATLRRPEMLPPAEIAEAIIQVVGKHVGISTEEAVVATCHLLGFRVRGPQLTKVIGRELDKLVAEGVLSNRDAKLFRGQELKVSE